MIQLLPLAIQLAGEFGPTLASMLIGPKAGEVSKTVVETTKKVFGTDEPAVIEQAVKDNPALAQLYTERIKAETEQYKGALADIADARAQTIELVRLGSIVAWGAAAVSAVVVVGFVIVVLIFMLFPISNDPIVLQTLGILFGYMGASLQQVVSYWVGSSAGSKDKDAILGAALISAQASVQKVAPKK